MFNFLRSQYLIAILIVTFCSLVMFSAPTNAQSHSPVETASRTAKTDLGPFSILPPHGYRYQSLLVEQKHLYAWTTPQYRSGPLRGLVIIIAPFPATALTAHSSVDFLAGVLDGMHTGWKNWHQSKFQYRQIQGQLFVQAEWSGSDSKGNRIQGFVYGSVLTAASKQYTCLLTGGDLAGSHLPVLQQANLAVQTFQAKN